MPHEYLESWNKQEDAVGIKVVRAVGTGLEMNGEPVRTLLCVRIELTMTMPDCVKECGRIWEGNAPTNVSRPVEYIVSA